MKNIDFLPERYHERELKRKAKIWQYALLLGFAVLLLAATLGQFAIRRSLQASLAELRQARMKTNLKRERVKSLTQQLASTEEVAALYTYLRHPWPRTQVLARITELLPESVVLQGIEILEQRPNSASFINNETREAASGTTPAAADLAQLRGNHDATLLVVRIRGTAEETAELNEYVRQLGEVPLFRGVSLSSLQLQSSRDQKRRWEFDLNVMVKPGHGQSGGPDAPLVKRDEIARYPVGRRAQ